MLSQLLLQIEIGNVIDEVVDRVNVRVHALEALDLLAYEQPVRDLLLQIQLGRRVADEARGRRASIRRVQVAVGICSARLGTVKNRHIFVFTFNLL